MNDDVLAIRNDEYQRNRFIEKYKPFLAKYTSTLTHRYVSYGEDEELSIALLAFNESIDRYNGEGLFFEFAKMVVRSRLLDYFNTKEYKERLQHEFYEDKDDYHLNQSAKDLYQKEQRILQLQEEIKELKKLLKYYHIEFDDLYKQSPKHFFTKKHVDDIIYEILKDDYLVSHIIDKGYLPMNRILKKYHTSQKRIEPYRQYIIAVILICEGQFDLLKDYMPRKVIKE